MEGRIDVLMVGKSGNGKSSLGNFLVGKEVFTVSEDTTSFTLEMAAEESDFKGTRIRVVDGPGVGDTRFNKLERVKQMQRWTQDAINMSPSGYHAVFLVFRFGVRCSDEEVEAVETLKKTFGPDLVKNHCVLVLTYGDNFETQCKRNPQTFKEWCKRQEGAFRKLMDECRGRVVLVDNYAEGASREAMIMELLKTVKKLGGVRYTDDKFAKAAMERAKAEVEAKKAMIQKETNDKMSLILVDLNSEKVKDGFEKSHFLDLQRRCEQQEDHVNKEDNGTGVLHDIIMNIRAAKQSITSEMSAIQKKKEMEEAMVQQKKEMEEATERRRKEMEETMMQQKKEMEEAAERRRKEMEEDRERVQRQMTVLETRNRELDRRQASEQMTQLFSGALYLGAALLDAFMTYSTENSGTSGPTITMLDDSDSD